MALLGMSHRDGSTFHAASTGLSRPQPGQSGEGVTVALRKAHSCHFRPWIRDEELELAWTAQEPSPHDSSYSVSHGVPLVGSNRLQWEYLCHRNWQML